MMISVPKGSTTKVKWQNSGKIEKTKYLDTFQLSFSPLKPKLGIRFEDAAWHQNKMYRSVISTRER